MTTLLNAAVEFGDKLNHVSLLKHMKLGILGEAQVDAHALLLTCCVAIYMGFPFGMSTAATIRVGNLVGANRPAEARLSGIAYMHHCPECSSTHSFGHQPLCTAAAVSR